MFSSIRAHFSPPLLPSCSALFAPKVCMFPSFRAHFDEGSWIFTEIMIIFVGFIESESLLKINSLHICTEHIPAENSALKMSARQ